MQIAYKLKSRKLKVINAFLEGITETENQKSATYRSDEDCATKRRRSASSLRQVRAHQLYHSNRLTVVHTLRFCGEVESWGSVYWFQSCLHRRSPSCLDHLAQQVVAARRCVLASLMKSCVFPSFIARLANLSFKEGHFPSLFTRRHKCYHCGKKARSRSLITRKLCRPISNQPAQKCSKGCCWLNCVHTC